MTTPSPFEIARSVGTNLSSTITNASDRTAIDDIMEQATKTKNPADMQQVIADVIKRVSPDRRQAVLGAVTEKAKQMQATQQKENTQKAYSKLADEVDKMPGQSNRVIASIFRADLPKDERMQALKVLMAVDPSKKNQQNRLERDSVLKAYNSRIKEINEELKQQHSWNADYKENVELRTALQAERDELLGFAVFQADKQKTPWDPKNPEHIDKLRELEKKFGGDKQKVNEALAEEFAIVNP